jgi:hypothetical protein
LNLWVIAWPGHCKLLDFGGSGNFVPVGVGKLPLDPELVHFGPPKTELSDNYAFMCQRMQVVLAPLPPLAAAEYKLFHVEIGRVAAQNKAPSRTDMHRIARTFLDRADGKVIFPKTVEMLQKQYVSWKFNQRLKDLQLRVTKTVDSLSTAFAKQRLTAPAICTFKLPQEPSKLLNLMMEQKTNFVPPEQVLPNSSFVSAKIKVPEKWQAQTPKLFRATVDSMKFNNTAVVDMNNLAKACAWFPHCTLQRVVCGGTTRLCAASLVGRIPS